MRDEVRPLVAEHWAEGTFPRQLVARFRESGLGTAVRGLRRARAGSQSSADRDDGHGNVPRRFASGTAGWLRPCAHSTKQPAAGGAVKRTSPLAGSACSPASAIQVTSWSSGPECLEQARTTKEPFNEEDHDVVDHQRPSGAQR
ncbi:hypothetical protein [Streptomyces mutabilis]|uniref:hypothetical protein n=1 Tax=Streptomyces mutabilis TaxID=67332 RepID=UPI002FCFC17A